MRDPDGVIYFEELSVRRELVPGAESRLFLESKCAGQLVSAGLLIEYEVDRDQLKAPRFPFVSYPYEWSASQLKDSALLTLDIADCIYDEGYELKDASAWNVIFNGCVPVFCDHLSFRKLRSGFWWALDQFSRNFIYPLVVDSLRILACDKVFRMRHDGLNVLDFNRLTGIRRFLSKSLPLTLSAHGAMVSERGSAGKVLHKYIYQYLRWALPSLKSGKSFWIGYVDSREHYGFDHLDAKRNFVRDCLDISAPSWVVDIGCNSGEFTKMAAEVGANVVAVDSDAACVDYLYQSCRGDRKIHPVICDISDMVAGVGFAGKEFPCLVSRLARISDTTLMLAVLHHLLFSAGVRISDVVAFVNEITSRFLIVELVSSQDVQSQVLLARRGRLDFQLDIENQLACFEEYFEVVAKQEIISEHRCVYFMKKKIHL